MLSAELLMHITHNRFNVRGVEVRIATLGWHGQGRAGTLKTKKNVLNEYFVRFAEGPIRARQIRNEYR